MIPELEVLPATPRDREEALGPARPLWRAPGFLLAFILLVSGSAIITAMRATSTTFDEIVMIAGGARGYANGTWDLAPEHPPFTQYMYGLLPYLSGVQYPDESNVPAAVRKPMGYRYDYAQQFFWGSGNDPETLAFLGRLPGALSALVLVVLVFGYTRRHYGDSAALLAAAATAFLPDVLAHAGVAYNDLPIATAYLAALWLIDAAIRRPTLARALAAGVVTGLALGIKNSAVALAPAALLLLVAEYAVRRGDRVWQKRILPAALLTPVAIYLTLVLVYRSDFALSEYRYALNFVFGQVTQTRAPSYLLGRVLLEPVWYYFPVAFLFKTSVGFQLLLVAALLYFARRVHSLRQVLSSPLRVPLIGILVFGALLLRSQLHIGFRYALPVLPLLAIPIGIAVARIWNDFEWKRARWLAALAFAWLILHPLSYYPHFLAYVNEYGPGRDRNYEVFADSSLDWGQGLLLLRDFMAEQGISRVYLSYFGSAWPSGYGIDYVPLYSFFQLPVPRNSRSGPPPQYAVISATNLTGTYFVGADPFANLRAQEPEYVLGHTLFVYRVQP